MEFGRGLIGMYALNKMKVWYRETLPRVLTIAKQFLGKIQTDRMKDIDVYDSSGVDLVGFESLSGTSSAVNAEISTLASSTLKSRPGTLNLEHEDLPPLTTEL
ncbi:hypothetical protein F5Y00DRAFT_267025 [Daldinia vernicosa]|uniref:uncharacterized protein n=1 Tax=Daldinia vernicosa TaxID=114800 RepID=UPI002008A29A|nr:uncharacterized protein F5Y00DRAFT_267025 [Daldinia vernicosa]KAI0843969.1 hypothetical protein F5Y00DRAFT_267025 [Daldinia vernicosa]